MQKEPNQIETLPRTGAQPAAGKDIGFGAGQIADANVGVEIAITKESNRASQMLNEGRLLAGLLHHEEYGVAHLLLAISRTPDGAQELSKHHVEAHNVNLLCWKALESQPVLQRIEPEQENPSGRAAVSVDIMEVHRWAGIIAAEKKQKTLELGDLIEAICAARISPRFVHLYAKEPVDVIFAETRDLVRLIKSRIEEEFPGVNKKLDQLQKSQNELPKSILKQFRKIRYLGFGLLAAIVVSSIYFGLR